MYDPDKLSKVSKSCFNNAKQYVKDAQLLYSLKSYGHALALTVLCDIELGKAVIYHLCSKGLITKEVLPNQFLPYYTEKKYEKLASETWWVGLVLASNVDVLVPNLFNLTNYPGKIKDSNSKLTQETKNQISKIISEMQPKNNLIHDFLEFTSQGFFVNFEKKESCSSPLKVKKPLVKKRIEEIKERIVNGEPFLLLSFSEIQKKIAKDLIKAAFESIIPMRREIKQLITIQ
jgi:AbiV family abortive infection protein